MIRMDFKERVVGSLVLVIAAIALIAFILNGQEQKQVVRSIPLTVQAAPPRATLTSLIRSRMGFSVEIASFKDRSYGFKLIKRLASLGVAAQMTQNAQWFHVFAGPYLSKARAEKVRHKVDHRFKLNTFITRRRDISQGER